MTSSQLVLLLTFIRVTLVLTDTQSGRFSLWVWPFVSQKVCYDDYGCFNNSYPYSSLRRKVTLLPEPPSVIQTRFFLYTRNTSGNPQEEELPTGEVKQLELSNFRGTKSTKMIIHGFTDNSKDAWVQTMIRELLTNEDMNVVAVDWEKGAKWPYMKAVANTRLVGVQTADFITFLIKMGNTESAKIHIIGHSLGAHIAGYASTALKPVVIGRISGLDPASIFFESSNPNIRLDASDAQFVDILHTDGGAFGFGLTDPLGHADFYPNNGMKQPGCDDKLKTIYSSLFDANAKQLSNFTKFAELACSHSRAPAYFTESINSKCSFLAFHCKSWKDFQVGNCRDCEHSGNFCGLMGYHTIPLQDPTHIKFYLTTSSRPPYCRDNYKIMLKISDQQAKQAWGQVTINVTGEKGHLTEELTRFRPLYNGPQSLVADQEIVRVFDSGKDIGRILSAEMSYLKDDSQFSLLSFLYDSTLMVQTVEVSKLKLISEDIKTYTYCNTTLNSTTKMLNVPENGTCSTI